MTTKVVKTLKYFSLGFLVFYTLISCEKEIESIGVNLVENNKFNTDKLVSEVTTENVNIEKVPANGLAQYLLGIYSDAEFGKLKASIVAQLSLPSTSDYVYGTNTTIDSVVISIPYQTTAEEDYDDGRPKFSIDSVFGNEDAEFQLDVYELKTFLNKLDPNDPTKDAIYYSDKVFEKGDVPFYSGKFKVNANDTVSYIKRLEADLSVYDIDTVKQDNVAPTIKLPLNKNLIQQIFVDNAGSSDFDSFENFSHYFRGFYIEASEFENDNSHLISLSMSNSKMTIYYSIDEDEDAEEDLNGNDVNGEQGVRTKHLYDFMFGGIKSNVFERDYTTSKTSGEDKLYIQGAAGSLATVDLFVNEELTDLQENNWLINEANLIFYVDQSASSNIVPEQLFLYNYDANEQITDMMTEGSVGGTLERDDEGNPYRYVFRITDYISELLKDEDSENLAKLAVKVYNPTDTPSSATDVKVEEYNWIPQGVVLYGSEQTEEKRIKLEVFYTELNN